MSGKDLSVGAGNGTPTLFELPPRFALAKAQQHVYDASRLLQERPDIHRAILVMTQRGDGQLLISETLGVSHHLVARVQEGSPDLVAIGKEARSRQNKRIDAVAGELLLKVLHEPGAEIVIPAMELAKIKKIAHEAAMGLDGDATVRVDVRVSAAPRHEALNAFVRDVRATHCAGEISGATREGGAAGKVAEVVVAEVVNEQPEALPPNGNA